MFNASTFNRTAFNSVSQIPNAKTKVVADAITLIDSVIVPRIFKTITDTVVVFDKAVMHLNGRIAGLWARVAKASNTGFTRVPRSSSDWEREGKQGGWERMPKDL